MPQSHLLEHRWANLSIPHFMASFPSAPCCQDNWPADFRAWGLEEHQAHGAPLFGRELVSRFSGSSLAPDHPPQGEGRALPAQSVPYKPQLPSSAMAPNPPMRAALSPPSGPPHQRLSGSAGCSGHRNGGGSSGLSAGVPVRCSAPGDVPV